jgi:hypothetical protein
VSEGQLFGHGGRLYAQPDEEKDEAELPFKHPIQREREERKRSDPPKPSPPAQIKVQPQPPQPPRDLREPVSTVLELLGVVAFASGFFLLAIWAGLIALGVSLVILGVALSPRWDRE